MAGYPTSTVSSITNRGDTNGYRAELQLHASQVSESLRVLADELQKNEDLLSKLIVVPNTHFPIHTQYMVAEHLLQTGIPLPVQEWIDSGQEYARDAESEEILSDFDRRRLWYDAPRTALAEARKQKWGADYTLAEIQAGVATIETGLTRELVEPPLDDEDEEFEDEEEEEAEQDEAEDDSMNVDGATAGDGTKGIVDAASAVPPMTMDVLMKFLSTAKDG